MKFDYIFEKLVHFTFHNRLIVLIAAITLCLIFSIGLVNIRLQSDAQGLWVSSDSLGYQQQKNFKSQFGAFFRTEQIMLVPNKQEQTNIFDKPHLYGLYLLISLLNKKSVFFSDRNVSINDLCYRPIISKGCYRPSVLDIWKMNITDLHMDPNIQYTAMCIQSRSSTSRIPCSDENEIPIIKQSIYGGIKCDNDQDKTSTIVIPCQHCWINATTLMATYLLNNNEYMSQTAQKWESQVLIDAIHKYNADNGSFIKEYAKYFDVDSNGNVIFENNFTLNLYSLQSSNLSSHFQYIAQSSISKQLVNETNENALIIIISYLAMLLYIGLAIGDIRSRITSGFTLSIIGVIIVLASVSSSMGLIAYLDIGFTLISGQVIPFLILAIGVDNMFIIKRSVEKQKDGDFEDRLAKGLGEIGPNITTTAICQALTFLVGSLTKIPALQNFCIQAAVAIIFNFIFQITIFILALIIDEQRKNKNRMDILFCIKDNSIQKKQPLQFWSNKFGGFYCSLLQKPVCIITVILISLSLLIFSIIGIFYIPIGLNEQVSMEINSDLFNYFTFEKKYIQIGPPAYIVLNNMNYQSQEHVATIANLSNEIAKLKYIQPPVYIWTASFNNFIMEDQVWSDVCNTKYISQYSYQQQLKIFLSVKVDSLCCQSYGLCGEQYSSDIVFYPNGTIKSSRLRVLHQPLRNSQDYIRAAREMRMAVTYSFSELFKKNPQIQVYPYSLFYVYYDQYSYIRSVAIQNLILALAAVFLIVTIIQNISIALIICGMVAIITIDLIGFIFITSSLFPDHGFILQINAISVVNFIICVGLSVEFTAHVCIAMKKKSGQAKQKLHQTLKDTGSSVFIGIGITKFIGVMVLCFAKSTIFRLYYFRMYLGIVILGLFNGLVFLPILLYLWELKHKAKINDQQLPKSLLSSDEIKKQEQQQ